MVSPIPLKPRSVKAGWTAEQHGLWTRVDDLWKMLQEKDLGAINEAIHPGYTGWVTGEATVHSRKEGLESADPSAPDIVDYKLHPVAVSVFEERTGVAHYRYEATIREGMQLPVVITGRWTEIYVRSAGNEWQLASVSGGPDGER